MGNAEVLSDERNAGVVGASGFTRQDFKKNNNYLQAAKLEGQHIKQCIKQTHWSSYSHLIFLVFSLLNRLEPRKEQTGHDATPLMHHNTLNKLRNPQKIINTEKTLHSKQETPLLPKPLRLLHRAARSLALRTSWTQRCCDLGALTDECKCSYPMWHLGSLSRWCWHFLWNERLQFRVYPKKYYSR